ncbi:MAG: ribulose-phosphate 3-epimerase [Acidobacteria bacterium]|nr:ribulose-phosphate 3-epimerase [Acidobacteriota bacterium]
MIQIAPSILAADFAALGEQVRTVEEAGAHLLHLDVMDGHFVPNITLGPPVVASIRQITRLPLDVHLMIENPDAYLEAFADAGADWISVHAEACAHLDRTLNRIRSLGLSTGVVLNPATSLSVLDNVLPLVDFVLIMSVNPGFGAQKFIPYSLQKIEELRKMIDRRGLSVKIEVDGGVSLVNLCALVRSGAEVLVAGSQIFGSPDPGAVVREMIDRSAGCTESGRDGLR